MFKCPTHLKIQSAVFNQNDHLKKYEKQIEVTFDISNSLKTHFKAKKFPKTTNIVNLKNKYVMGDSTKPNLSIKYTFWLADIISQPHILYDLT